MAKQSGTPPEKDVIDPRDLTIGSLHAFMCVAKLGGYSKAARFLGVSQSTVSRQVKALEETVGMELLSNTIPPRPTEEGKRISALSEKFISALFMNPEHLYMGMNGRKLGRQTKENLKLSLMSINHIDYGGDIDNYYNRDRAWDGGNIREEAEQMMRKHYSKPPADDGN